MSTPKTESNKTCSKVLQDWGRQFSEDKLADAMQKTQLKRLPTVEVCYLPLDTLALETLLTLCRMLLIKSYFSQRADQSLELMQ